jgi:hypothetical protein
MSRAITIFLSVLVVLILLLELSSWFVGFLYYQSLVATFAVVILIAGVSAIGGLFLCSAIAKKEAGDEWFTAERKSARQWFWVNCVIIGTGGLGLLGFALDAKKDIGEIERASKLPIYHGALASLESDMRFFQNWFCDMRFNWNPDVEPKSKFDAAMEEKSTLCKWFTNTTTEVAALTDESGRKLVINNWPSASYYADMIVEAKEAYGRFEHDRSRLFEAEGQAPGELRLIFLMLAPLFFAIALGLAIAKARFVP